MRRVVFAHNFGPYVGEFPETADKRWLKTKEFKVAFGHWTEELRERRDFFLGYCSAAATASKQGSRISHEKRIGATVLDWQRDFKYSRTIIDEIEEARVRCNAGIFLVHEGRYVSKTRITAASSATRQCGLRSGLLLRSQRQEPRTNHPRGWRKNPSRLGWRYLCGIQTQRKFSIAKREPTSIRRRVLTALYDFQACQPFTVTKLDRDRLPIEFLNLELLNGIILTRQPRWPAAPLDSRLAISGSSCS